MLDMLISILCIVGVYGFFTGFTFLLFIGCTAAVIWNLVRIFTGQFRIYFGLFFFLAVGIIISIKADIGILWGIAIGLCFEQAVMGFMGIITLLFGLIVAWRENSKNE